MEAALGHDFSSVRIHEGGHAESLGAIAYTRGRDIHFAPGRYSPQSHGGQELLGHELAHVVQQSKGRVAMPQGAGAPINADPGLEAEAERLGRAAARGHNPSGFTVTPAPAGGQSGAPVQRSKVIQAWFYERNAAGGHVWWNQPMSWAGGTKRWKPWIDPATGVQGVQGGHPVYFQFDKTGLTRQKVKGNRGVGGNTTGLVLGDQAQHQAAGLGAWPGSRNWPGAMGTATAARNASPGPAAVTNSWGHQVAMQWGGPARQWNAAAATNAGAAGGHAQELYQTAVEDAVTHVVANYPGFQLDQFRIKHTAYNYPGTNAAKYMRIKLYHQNPAGGPIVKLVDQVTPDYAEFLAGGRAQAGTARRAFQKQIERQLRRRAAAPPPGKRGTDPAVVRSWAAAPTPARPGRRCFLTTACTAARGLPDDCPELTELRRFRDGAMQALADGPALVAEYYRVAPAIVAAIERHPDRDRIHEGVYQDLVLPALALIRAGRDEEAVDHYRDQVWKLRDRLLTSSEQEQL